MTGTEQRKACVTCNQALDPSAVLCPHCGAWQSARPPLADATFSAAPPIMNMRAKKSVLVAVVLALLFGPLGLLYCSALGAVTMFAVNIVCFAAHAGSAGMLFSCLFSAMWACAATSASNDRVG